MILSKIISKILRSKATTLSRIILPLFSAGFLVMILLILSSCSTSRQVQMQVAEHIHKDTIYLSNIQYDSIYILHDKYTDRSKDTVLVKETKNEYKYKLLKDTVLIVQQDSIPYEVRITEVKEARKPPNIFDYLSYLSFGILIGVIGWKIYRLFRIL